MLLVSLTFCSSDQSLLLFKFKIFVLNNNNNNSTNNNNNIAEAWALIRICGRFMFSIFMFLPYGLLHGHSISG